MNPFGEIHDPVADVSARLGTLAVPRTLQNIISAFVDGLPLTAALSLQINDYDWIVHWVSGSTLVTVQGDSGELEDAGGGLQRHVGHATGTVRSLAGVDAELSGTAEASFDGRDWSVSRRVTVRFDDGAVTFPDERFRLDNVTNRAQAEEFITALLQGIAGTAT